MVKHSRTLAACLLSACLWGPGAKAASSAGRFRVDKWTTEEGLPENAVIALTQTRDGYLWLGTLKGLVRFDGVGQVAGGGRRQFPVFDTANTPELGSDTIVKLFEDSRTNLWIGTENAGVAVVKDGKLTRVELETGTQQGRLFSICEDTSGSIWLRTEAGQLYRYRVDQNKVDVRLSGCTALATDDSGIVWIGTVDGRLIGLGPMPKSAVAALPVAHELPAVKLDFLQASKRGGYWLLAGGHIQKWNADRLAKDLGPYPWTNAVQITSACEDQDGNLILGTYGDGVYWFDAQGRAAHLSGQELSHGSVLSLTMDREGNLWVGTNGGGLNRVKRQLFDVLPGTEGSVVQSVCEDQKGGLWIGYNEERVDHWNQGDVKHYNRLWPSESQVRQGMVNPSVRSVFEDQGGQVWAGVWAGVWSGLGPRMYRFQDDQFKPAPGTALVNSDVSAIFQDKSANLWVGTKSGLAHWDKRRWALLTTRDGLSSDEVEALAEDVDGNLWIGTLRGGLNKFHDGHFTVFRKEQHGLPSDDVASIYIDNDNVLWAGTAGGLARLQNGKWTRYGVQEGLTTHNVGYLVEDSQGFLWMGSNAGLMRAPKKALNDLARGLTNSVPCRSYGKADGMLSSESTSGSQPAACRGSDGRLLFPTINGLAYINPTDLLGNTNVPPVVIESVLIDDLPQGAGSLRTSLPQEIIVPAGAETLEINYTSLNLTAPDRASFEYRMEEQNHETAWTKAGNDRAARYTKLAPGHYRFHVKACNEDGLWNQTGCALDLVVLPSFYQTAWFRAAVILAILGMVIGSVYYVSTQRLHRQLENLRQKEALEKERGRIGRDLHDQLGANLTQVALLAEMAEADKGLPAEVEAHARQISQTARETTNALDEIVWTVNPANDTLEGLINYVCKYAQEYLALAGLSYRIEAPPQLPNGPITPELRHNVFLVAKEAVNNLVKHSQAKAAWLRLKLEKEKFILEIEDNGRGVPASAKDKGRSGLSNMRKRMEDVGGTFELGPGQDGGTKITLTAPLDR